MGRTIAIANQKGGVGKTTTAVNLGASLANLNKKVLIVDIDPQGNACSGLGISKDSESNSIYELIMNQCTIDDVIIPTHLNLLDMIPVNIHLIGAQIELVPFEDREQRLKQSLASIKEVYDYIFIDCPPSLGLLTLNGLVAADTVLIPLQSEFYALEGLTQLLQTIKRVQRVFNPSLTIEGVVVTMYDSRTTLSNQVYDEAVKYFKDKVFKTIIPRNIKLGEAPSHGKPIIEYDIASTGSKSYLSLAQEVVSHA